MDMHFPAITTGVVTRLSGRPFGRDGATHMLTNPMGSIRLRGADRTVLENLEVIEGGEVPVLLRGRYWSIETVGIHVTEIGRIDLNLQDDETEESGTRIPSYAIRPIGQRALSGAWPWHSGPGDSFPWAVEPPFPRIEGASIAKLQVIDGAYLLSVEGYEYITDNCHAPAPEPAYGDRIDDIYTPNVYTVTIGLRRLNDVCIALLNPREDAWRFERRIHSQPKLVQVVHATGQIDVIEVAGP